MKRTGPFSTTSFRPLRLLWPTAVALLLTACAKEPKEQPEPAPLHIAVAITEMTPWETPGGYTSPTAFTVIFSIRIDSLPDGELPEGMGHMRFVPHGQSASFRHHHCRGFPVGPHDLDDYIGGTNDAYILCMFQIPGTSARYRAYLRTSKGIYYSEPVTHAIPAIATDDDVTELPTVFHLLYADDAPLRRTSSGRSSNRHSATRTWGCATAFNPKRGRAPTRTCVWYAPPPTPPDARSPKRASTACGAATCRSIPKR